MTKAIFTTKINPTYDDQPEERYHFPRTYLNQVRAAVGDWIVYYEPRRQDADDRGRAGRQAYFAIARVTGIRPDPKVPDHFYADVADYLDFDVAVSFRHTNGTFEQALQRADGKVNRGAFGRAVRNLSDNEYEQILRSGFAPVIAAAGRPQQDATVRGLLDDSALFERPIVEQLVRRPFRDAAFAKGVADAYKLTCAFTGLKIINGGGRAEIEAAHIRPVGDGHNGPDTIRNGIGLSRTIHWMFDRGLLSLTDDCRILRSSKLPQEAQRLLYPDGIMRVPELDAARPHPRFLRYHRENIFKE